MHTNFKLQANITNCNSPTIPPLCNCKECNLAIPGHTMLTQWSDLSRLEKLKTKKGEILTQLYWMERAPQRTLRCPLSSKILQSSRNLGDQLTIIPSKSLEFWKTHTLKFWTLVMEFSASKLWCPHVSFQHIALAMWWCITRDIGLDSWITLINYFELNIVENELCELDKILRKKISNNSMACS
jgi:hypothetical protein